MGVNSMAQGFLVKDSMTDDSYFNFSEMKLSITSLYIIFDARKYDISWTENSDVIDSSILEIQRSTNPGSLRPGAKDLSIVRFTPEFILNIKHSDG